jgi:metallophosphoesterase superfamily enzyme
VRRADVGVVKFPSRAVPSYELARGVVALAPGLAWLPGSRSLIAADAHLAYEDVVGGALPLWSTAEIVATIALAAERIGAKEIVFLGDIIHGAQMSEGAIRVVRDGLAVLRSKAELTLVAGNHEGRSRAFRVLGSTVEECERDGWLLVHGDKPAALGRRAIIGHLHPSLHLGGRTSAPAFVASDALVVVPALTPYSPGLDVLSADFADAIGLWSVRRGDVHVVATANDSVYPFGALGNLRDVLRAPAPRRSATPQRYRRRRLGPG